MGPDTPEGPWLSWPATQVRVRFTGASVAVGLRHVPDERDVHGVHHANVYDVTVDGRPLPPLTVSPERTWYPIADNLGPGPHVFTLFKRTEALMGQDRLLGLRLAPDGALLTPPPRPNRRLEFIGDSVTTGYGNEGAGPECPLQAATENQARAFPSLVARALDAEAVVLAWSGRGLWRNEDGSTQNTLPELYLRAVPNRPESRWSFRSGQPEPQAVVLSAGANDFVKGVPPEPRFLAAYRGFLERLRQDHPAAHLFLVVNAKATDDYPPHVQLRGELRRYAQALVEERRRNGDPRVHFVELSAAQPEDGLGCDFHPSVATHHRMARELEQALRAILEW